ncbi:MAG: hypothetical protein ACTSVI_12725 [Promethearchaeota archaeon]
MEIFRLSNGQIVQIISKDKIKNWEAEVPVLFIDYILDKKLESYGSKKDQETIKKYLNEIFEEIAIPKLTEALKSKDVEMRLNVSKRLELISKQKPTMIKAVLPFLNEREKEESDKVVRSAITAAIKNYDKSLKRKAYAAKRKKMQDLDKKLLAGKITPEEYAKARKDFLKISQEIEE